MDTQKKLIKLLAGNKALLEKLQGFKPDVAGALEPMDMTQMLDASRYQQQGVSEAPSEGPREYVRSGFEKLLGMFAPNDRVAANAADKLTNLSDFINPAQAAFDGGKALGSGDKLGLAMSMIPGKIKNLKGELVEAPRKFFRGTNPGDTRRISTGNADWDSHLFAADNADDASMYGKEIQHLEASPDAKILYEGTPDWNKVAGKIRKDENLLQYADRASKAAKAAGYDAAWFQRQSSVGTAIFNPDKFGPPMIPGKADEAGAAAIKKLKAYHATRNDFFDKFGPAPEYRGSTYLALTPEGAKKGSTGGNQDFYDVGDRRPQKLLEVELDDDGIQGLHWTPKEREWYASMPDRIEGDDALNAAFQGQPNNGNIPWDDIYEPRQIGDRLYEYIKKPPKQYSVDEVLKTNRDISGGQLPGYQDRDVESAKRLREQGMKGFLVNDEAGVSIAHIDPETLNIVQPKGIRAYHGTPHDFDKFSLDKIGTGEGAQAYGHGLYFAENEGVARGYRDALSDNTTLKPKPEFANDPEVARIGKQLSGMMLPADDINGAIKELGDRIAVHSAAGRTQDAQRMGEFKELLERNADKYTGGGHMYEVNINADPDAFLDWDKPLSEHSPKVRDAVHDLFKSGALDGKDKQASKFYSYPGSAEHIDTMTGERIREMLAAYRTAGQSYGYQNLPMIKAGTKGNADATRLLTERGIPGIKYLDAGSRGNVDTNDIRGSLSMWEKALSKTPNDAYAQSQVDDLRQKLKQAEGAGSRNYVVFDENIINIVKKYGLAAAVAGGVITQQDADEMKAQGLVGA